MVKRLSSLILVEIGRLGTGLLPVVTSDLNHSLLLMRSFLANASLVMFLEFVQMKRPAGQTRCLILSMRIFYCVYVSFSVRFICILHNMSIVAHGSYEIPLPNYKIMNPQ